MIHFCAALVISVVMTIPWLAVSHLAACLAALAIIGLTYSLTVIVHARKSTGYQPDAGDLFWYAGLPVLAYLMLGVAAILVWTFAVWSLFLVAAISVLFPVHGYSQLVGHGHLRGPKPHTTNRRARRVGRHPHQCYRGL